MSNRGGNDLRCCRATHDIRKAELASVKGETGSRWPL